MREFARVYPLQRSIQSFLAPARHRRLPPWRTLVQCRGSSTTSTTTIIHPNDDKAITDTSSAACPHFPQSFDDLSLHPNLRATVAANGWTKLTPVQAQTWQPVLEGRDVVALAGTGTGKTLAFLLPSAQRLFYEKDETASATSISTTTATATPSTAANNPREDGFAMLIVAPSRELARQSGIIARELQLPVLTIHGGSGRKRDVSQWTAMTNRGQRPSILVATPGRLLHHIEATVLPTDHAAEADHVDAPNDDKAEVHASNDFDTVTETQQQAIQFRDLLSQVRILVLDEMDTLLNKGFRKAIQEILQHLPTDRQTLLVSATSSPDVQSAIQDCVRSDQVVTIDCLNKSSEKASPGTDAAETLSHSYVIVPTHDIVWALVDMIRHFRKSKTSKFIVFFPTTAQVQFFALLLQQGIGIDVMEMHGQLSQGRRSVVSDRFRALQNGILLTTDVSARGMDYPHVTHVVQVGVTQDLQTYRHRLGRTGRAGQAGKGILVLTPAERPFLDHLVKLTELPPLTPHNFWQSWIDKRQKQQWPDNSRMEVVHRVFNGEWPALEENISHVYEALLRYYSSQLRQWSSFSRNDESWKDFVVESATEYCRQAGLREAPTLTIEAAERLGLENHPGVVVRERWEVGRGFDVGVAQAPPGWSEDAPRSRKGLYKERMTTTSGIWDEEFEQ